MSDKTALTYKEYNALRGLAAMMSVAPYTQDGLKRRLDPADWRLLRAAGGLITRVFDKVVDTIPANKLMGLKEELKHTKLDVFTNYAGMKREAVNWVTMPEDVAVRICKRAQCMECVLCEKHGKEIKRCELRRLLNETLMYEPPTPSTDNCIYAEQSIEAAVGKTFDELVNEEMKV